MPDPQEAGILPDDLPRRALLSEPLRVDRIDVDPVEPLGDGAVRVTFRLTVRDADGKRCADLAVDARIDGPERSASGMSHTDLMGQVRFRMAGPAGRYAIEVLDVAAGALTIDRAASQLTAETTASSHPGDA